MSYLYLSLLPFLIGQIAPTDLEGAYELKSPSSAACQKIFIHIAYGVKESDLPRDIVLSGEGLSYLDRGVGAHGSEMSRISFEWDPREFDPDLDSSQSILARKSEEGRAYLLDLPAGATREGTSWVDSDPDRPGFRRTLEWKDGVMRLSIQRPDVNEGRPRVYVYERTYRPMSELRGRYWHATGNYTAPGFVMNGTQYEAWMDLDVTADGAVHGSLRLMHSQEPARQYIYVLSGESVADGSKARIQFKGRLPNTSGGFYRGPFYFDIEGVHASYGTRYIRGEDQLFTLPVRRVSNDRIVMKMGKFMSANTSNPRGVRSPARIRRVSLKNEPLKINGNKIIGFEVAKTLSFEPDDRELFYRIAKAMDGNTYVEFGAEGFFVTQDLEVGEESLTVIWEIERNQIVFRHVFATSEDSLDED